LHRAGADQTRGDGPDPQAEAGQIAWGSELTAVLAVS
jgi:hypothetical protein